MNKKLIRLTESDLHRIIKESVNKVLNEDGNYWNNLKNASVNALSSVMSNPLSMSPLYAMKNGGNPDVKNLWKALFGMGGGNNIQNEINQALDSLNKLQKSGILQIDQNANVAVQNCIRSLWNFGKQTQQIKQQMQQNQQTQQNSQNSNDLNVDAEAMKTIRGEYGNGQERKNKLGTNYQPIQNRVNQMKKQGVF